MTKKNRDAWYVNLCQLLLIPHGAEEVHDTGVNDQQNTSTRTQPQYLGREALVQRSKALLLENGRKRWPRPVVLGDLTGNLGGVLNPGLDDIHGGVEDGTESSTGGTGQHVVHHLLVLVVGLGEQSANLEDTAEVPGVPEDVAPHGALEAVVQGEWALLLHNLRNTVDHAGIFACR